MLSSNQQTTEEQTNKPRKTINTLIRLAACKRSLQAEALMKHDRCSCMCAICSNRFRIANRKRTISQRLQCKNSGQRSTQVRTSFRRALQRGALLTCILGEYFSLNLVVPSSLSLILSRATSSLYGLLRPCFNKTQTNRLKEDRHYQASNLDRDDQVTMCQFQ